MFAKAEDGIAGGAVAAVLSGVPSSAHALATRTNLLEATLAAGTIVRPRETRPVILVAAAIPTHIALSLGWGAVLGLTLPRRHTTVAGALAGLAIAALDLGIVGRRYPRIRALPLAPQVGDHVAFGAVAGAVIARRRRDRQADVCSGGVSDGPAASCTSSG
jgi:hypothetical protein